MNTATGSYIQSAYDNAKREIQNLLRGEPHEDIPNEELAKVAHDRLRAVQREAIMAERVIYAITKCERDASEFNSAVCDSQDSPSSA